MQPRPVPRDQHPTLFTHAVQRDAFGSIRDAEAEDVAVDVQLVERVIHAVAPATTDLHHREEHRPDRRRGDCRLGVDAVDDALQDLIGERPGVRGERRRRCRDRAGRVAPDE